MHNKHEHTVCNHDVKYCNRCDVCYCELCGKEWCYYKITYGSTYISPNYINTDYNKNLYTTFTQHSHEEK